MSDDQHEPAAARAHTAPPASNAARIMGGILYVFGILVMGLSGLCTGIFFIAQVPETLNGSPGNVLTMLGVIAVVGGIPFAVGFVLFWFGRKMRQ